MTQHRCLLCSQTLLRHIRHGKLYWFCRHCYQEMPIAEDGIPQFEQRGTASASFGEHKQLDPSLWQQAESELETLNDRDLTPFSLGGCSPITKETIIQQLEVALSGEAKVSDPAPIDRANNSSDDPSDDSPVNTAPSRHDLKRVSDYLHRLREECDLHIKLINDLLNLQPNMLLPDALPEFPRSLFRDFSTASQGFPDSSLA